ncbi:hypothetical protein A5893_09265 [Pedobacter psychrophilus]|uniref:Uncharacterized protein n=1 Tax=Pedobacter psychrophilus TaxID=1826909 RepID=A0A179DGE8_9SPHI|nr:hypothetical protein [Pedobacter psychrophilus]OAQ39760.1 hypothetical protein A5893_09265 [Pedobacter psychrophilus]
MDNKVKNALESLFNTFTALENVSGQQELSKLNQLFNGDEDFMTKLMLMDQVFDDAPKLDALREVTFDLLLINFFAEDTKKLDEDYLDSPEWEKIEEETLDRGTELLNLLLYLNECDDEDIEPSLDDYLKEFLLVEEDEFQDEHRIYEEVIANQMLMESNIEEIARVSKSLDEESEIREIFYPMMAFFYDTQPSDADIKKIKDLSEDPAFDAAILSLILTFNQ